MLIWFDELDLLIGLVVLLVLLPILWWRKRSLSYLLFFSIFWLYILAVIRAVFFPVAINTDHNGAFSLSINLIPFYFRDCSMLILCVRGIIENIILTIPFGFGINFLTRIKQRNIFWLALTVGLGFELYQLLISLVFRSGFRTVDINDSILNGTGVLLGYALFRAFTWVYIKVTTRFNIKHKWLFAYIYKISHQAQVSGKL